MQRLLLAVLLSLALCSCVVGGVQFGHSLRPLFGFGENYTNLNHGSYGAPPRSVMAKNNAYHDEMELAPDVWFRYKIFERVDRVRSLVASYLGSAAKDLVFVDNASQGINSVLRSLRFTGPRSKILFLNVAYQMVKNTMQFVHNMSDAQLLIVNISIPSTADEIVAAVTATLDHYPGQVQLASFSHITSIPAMIMPIKELAAVCRTRGVMVLIDGAHVPGQMALNISAIGADFYVGNGHKWLYSPQGSAFLWVAPERQALIFPTVISLEGQGESFYQMAFSWLGTADYSPFLAVEDALQFRADLGESAIVEYLHSLAVDGGHLLASRWGTEMLLPPDMIAAMVNVRLPTDNCTQAGLLPQLLLEKYNTWVPAYAWQGHCYVRVSAQIYLELSDFEFLASAVLNLLAASTA